MTGHLNDLNESLSCRLVSHAEIHFFFLPLLAYTSLFKHG